MKTKECKHQLTTIYFKAWGQNKTNEAIRCTKCDKIWLHNPVATQYFKRNLAKQNKD